MKMDTLVIGDFKIELPIGLPEGLHTKVRDGYQAFLKESTNDVRRHLTCLTTLLPPEILGMYEPKVLHAFGGLGASAQVIDQTIVGAHHTFWERDPVCVEYLRSQYPDQTVVFANDSMPWLATEDLSVYDVLLLDMSVGTIKTEGVKSMWKNVAAAVAEQPGIVVWFTDTACHKIHLNHKSYEKDFGWPVEPRAESYLDAYCNWLDGYGLVITAAMREAGEFYCVVRNNSRQRFQTIPYV